MNDGVVGAVGDQGWSGDVTEREWRAVALIGLVVGPSCLPVPLRSDRGGLLDEATESASIGCEPCNLGALLVLLNRRSLIEQRM